LTTHPNGWPVEQKAEAMRLYAEGWSTRQIAIHICKTYGVIRTKNAVIGMLHRAGVRVESTGMTRIQKQTHVQRSMKPKHRPWTALRDKRLTELWLDGVAPGKIADILGGINTAGIVQRAIEMKLPTDAEKRAKAKAKAEREKSAIKPPTPPAPQPPLPPAPARHDGGGCRYPFGDPGRPDFRFCEAPKRSDSSYCPEHHRRCYTPLSKDQRRNLYRIPRAFR